MTSGGQCVMTAGAVLMLLSSANSWDMHTLEVNIYSWMKMQTPWTAKFSRTVQLALHTAMLTLVLELAPFPWMMCSVLQVLASY